MEMADQKLLLTPQPEKPNHYTYLKEFRVDQCQSFLQHKCNQHRPFVCFNWHFMNQRRRRPVRKRDGTFNYSADNYCTKYDETTGICPDGDDCPYLHRTAGDTERRYHLRYYKTCMCVHDTDSRGYCVKNGHHCAFAHGILDQRPPVYDIKELESVNTETTEGNNGPNVLDKERNLMNEDPKWQDTNYVLANYKTEPCKRPPRLCRQGYACPQYHNSKDKRRSPRKFKYRSTPCPNVKHGEEWGEPANCEAGDNCQYCHTRTEQQFHPEIYKSTKCNDVQQAGYCPRSVFCAFAHVEQDVQPREMDGSALGDLLSGALTHDMKKDKMDASSTSFLQNGNAESCESASTSSIGSTNSHSKAPGAQLQQKNNMFLGSSSNLIKNNISSSGGSNSISHFADYNSELSKPLSSIDEELEKEQHRLLMPFGMSDLSRNDMVSNHMDNNVLSSSSMLNNSSAPVNIPSSPLANSLSGLLQGTTAPVNIPGSSLNNFSPSNHSNLFSIDSYVNYSGGNGSLPKLNSSYNPADMYSNYSSHFQSPGINDTLSMSPDLRITDLHPIRDDLSFENNLNHNKPYSMSPSLIHPDVSRLRDEIHPIGDVSRLREEVATKSMQLLNLEEKMVHVSKVCEAWKQELEEANRKVSAAELQKDEAVNQLKSFKESNLQNGPSMPKDIKCLTIQQLKSLESDLKTYLNEVENELYLATATKCMTCEERTRSVTFVPCNHYVICDTCAKTARICPYCQTPGTIASCIQ